MRIDAVMVVCYADRMGDLLAQRLRETGRIAADAGRTQSSYTADRR